MYTSSQYTTGAISYVIRPHVDQNTQESRTTARVTKEKGLFTPRKGTVLVKKKGYGRSEKRHGT